MSAINQILLTTLDEEEDLDEFGFGHWIDGQPLAGLSEGTMTFWANGQPIIVEGD